MRRIYFLVPNLETTHKIVDELRAAGIEDRLIHVLAQRDTPLGNMPEASVSRKPILSRPSSEAQRSALRPVCWRV